MQGPQLRQNPTCVSSNCPRGAPRSFGGPGPSLLLIARHEIHSGLSRSCSKKTALPQRRDNEIAWRWVRAERPRTACAFPEPLARCPSIGGVAHSELCLRRREAGTLLPLREDPDKDLLRPPPPPPHPGFIHPTSVRIAVAIGFSPASFRSARILCNHMHKKKHAVAGAERVSILPSPNPAQPRSRTDRRIRWVEGQGAEKPLLLHHREDLGHLLVNLSAFNASHSWRQRSASPAGVFRSFPTHLNTSLGASCPSFPTQLDLVDSEPFRKLGRVRRAASEGEELREELVPPRAR